MFYIIAMAVIVACVSLRLYLESLNRRNVEKHTEQVPAAFREWLSAEKYQHSCDYTLAKSRFQSWEMIYETIVIIAVLSSGLLPALFAGLETSIGSGIWADALILWVVMTILSLPNLPWEWASQFRLEERFGFNKTTPALWVSDKFKGTLLSLIIGVPVLAALLYFYHSFQKHLVDSRRIGSRSLSARDAHPLSHVDCAMV